MEEITSNLQDTNLPVESVSLSVPITGTSDGHIKDAIWKRLSNFHDISWLYNSTSSIKEKRGDPYGVGATRTFNFGFEGTETVIERVEKDMFLKWTLSSYKDYEASIKVTDDEIRFSAKGQVPKEMLQQGEPLMKAGLSKVVAEAIITEDDKLIMCQHVGFLDLYTRQLLRSIPKQVLKASSEPTTDAVVTEPNLEKQSQSKINKIAIGKHTLKLLANDDYYGDLSFRDRVVFSVLANTCLFPINDFYVDFPQQLADKFRGHFLFDKCFPPPNHYLDEIETDEAISRMFFYGVMSLWLKDDTENPENKGGFMCDYSSMAQLETRKGFRKLGAKAYFDGDGKLIRIYDCSEKRAYKPDSPGWNEAKMLLKVSSAHWNTACDHLMGVHMVVSNSVVYAAVQNLEKTHGIRRLLQPFSFRSVYVNNRSIHSLLDPGSIVSHASCYAHAELEKLLEMGFEKCEQWATPEEWLENAGTNVQKRSNEGKFPFGSHSSKLFNCFTQFVENIVGHIYKTDEEVQCDNDLQGFARDLHEQVKGAKFYPPNKYETKADVIKVISTFIFNATAMHEHVGTVSEYINHPKKLGFRLREGATTIDFQAWLVGMLLFTVTTVPMPKLLDKFEECFTWDYEREEWDKCLEGLKKVSTELKEDNRNARYPCRSFDPEFLECSVNV